MVNYPVFFLLLSTWTWDTFLTLRGTSGFYLNHGLPHRPSKRYGLGEGVDLDLTWILDWDLAVGLSIKDYL